MNELAPGLRNRRRKKVEDRAQHGTPRAAGGEAIRPPAGGARASTERAASSGWPSRGTSVAPDAGSHTLPRVVDQSTR